MQQLRLQEQVNMAKIFSSCHGGRETASETEMSPKIEEVIYTLLKKLILSQNL